MRGQVCPSRPKPGHARTVPFLPLDWAPRFFCGEPPMSDQPALPTLDDARQLLAAADSLLAGALARARVLTKNGKAIDDHQVLAERVAYAATEARAARELIEYAAGRPQRRSRRRVARSHRGGRRGGVGREPGRAPHTRRRRPRPRRRRAASQPSPPICARSCAPRRTKPCSARSDARSRRGAVATRRRSTRRSNRCAPPFASSRRRRSRPTPSASTATTI